MGSSLIKAPKILDIRNCDIVSTIGSFDLEIIYTDSENEKYNLTKKPPENSNVVLFYRKETLQNLDLKNVLINIENAAGLLFVTYNALAGTKLQSKAQTLQQELFKLNDDCIICVQRFKSKSRDMTTELQNTYKWLVECEESMAVKCLKRFGGIAKEMANECAVLAQRFDDISAECHGVLTNTMDQQAEEYKRKREIEEQLKELKSKTERLRVETEQLNSTLEDIAKEYEELKQKEAVEEKKAKRAQWLSFASGIVSSLNPAQLIGNVVTAVSKSPEGAASPESGELNQKNSEKANLEAKNKEEEEKAGKLEDEINTLENEISELKKEQETLNPATDKERIDEIQNEISGKENNKQEKQTEKESVAASILKNKEVLASINNAIGQLNEKLKEMEAQHKEKAAQISDAKKDLFSKKLELEKTKREALSDMAGFAVLVEGCKQEGNSTEAAIETLQVAIKCLKSIVTALQDAAMFWKQVQLSCENLANDEFSNMVEDIQDLPEEKRKQHYYRADFMFLFLKYCAQWAALESICVEYLDASSVVRNTISQNIKASPTREEAWKQAPILAAEFEKKLEILMEEYDGRIATLELQKNTSPEGE